MNLLLWFKRTAILQCPSISCNNTLTGSTFVKHLSKIERPTGALFGPICHWAHGLYDSQPQKGGAEFLDDSYLHYCQHNKLNFIDIISVSVQNTPISKWWQWCLTYISVCVCVCEDGWGLIRFVQSLNFLFIPACRRRRLLHLSFFFLLSSVLPLFLNSN